MIYEQSLQVLKFYKDYVCFCCCYPGSFRNQNIKNVGEGRVGEARRGRAGQLGFTCTNSARLATAVGLPRLSY